MGLKITTDGRPVTVYANERTTQSGGKFMTYCVGVASKDKAGNWVNGYLDCQFKKDVVVNNKAKIEIENAFYTVTDNGGKKYLKLFITDFAIVEPGENAIVSEEFMNIPDGIDEELPFS